MAGITAYGAYIPYHRLSRDEIARSWGGASAKGERVVANYDEDSITMAVAAAMDCIKGMNVAVDGVYFASTTSPYREKQAAVTVAAAMDLDMELVTADYGNSLRCGTTAMRTAADAVGSGSAKNILVCAADMRQGYPKGDDEMSFGDGAAAFLIGDENVIADIEGWYSVGNEMIDVWRNDSDIFVRSWEERFGREMGYGKVVPEAVSAALKKFNLTPKDITKFVCYAPNDKQLATVAKSLGFDVKTALQDTFYDSIGNSGSASVFISLVAALEGAKAGDRILLASYGNGCDVLLLKVTEEIKNFVSRRAVKSQLNSKAMIPYYKYSIWRGLVKTRPMPRPEPITPSAVALWRDNQGGLTLSGSKCKNCGTIQYPRQRVCINCRAKDNYEPYRFADKTGVLFTFSHDNLALSVDPPSTICTVDFPEGGRIMCDMTDRVVKDVKVGMPVEMTFRKIGSVGGIYNYWWKCRPIR